MIRKNNKPGIIQSGFTAQVMRSFIFLLPFIILVLLVPGQASAAVISSNLTLQNDQTINEDLEFTGGYLDLNGYKLTINGNLIQPGGIMMINGGRLNVDGDYRIQSKTVDSSTGAVTYGQSTGSLQMPTDSDYVKVNGSFVTQSTGNSDTYINGILEVKGDFTQLADASTSSYFRAFGAHKVILSGTGLQTVSFENITSRFNYLQITNTSIAGVKIKTPIAFNSPLQYDLTLIPCNGDIQCTGNDLDLNGHTLTIKGNLIQEDGKMRINGGRLNVEGDYRIQTKTVDVDTGTIAYGDSLGVLQMNNDNDYVRINGSFVTQSLKDEAPNTGSGLYYYLQKGTLEVKGDFNKISSAGNFRAWGTHKVLLSGTGLQTVSCSSVLFNYLQITNTSTAGVKIKTPIAFRDGAPLQYDLTLVPENGDIQYVGNRLDLNGHTLTIKGNLIQSVGYLLINGGRLNVEGDYRIQTKTIDDTGSITYDKSPSRLVMNNVADYILVKGSFVTQSSFYEPSSGPFRYGTLEVKGDFAQINGGYVNNFFASNNHKVLLSGTGLQTVYFETPSTYSVDSSGNVYVTQRRSQFNTLVIKNSNYQLQSPVTNAYFYNTLEDWILDRNLLFPDQYSTKLKTMVRHA